MRTEFASSVFFSRSVAAAACSLIAVSSAHAGSYAAVPPSTGELIQQIKHQAQSLELPSSPVAIPSHAQSRLPGSVFVRIKRVSFHGNSALSDKFLQSVFAPILGKKVSLATISSYVGKIDRAYSKAGYPVAFAYLPPQQIADGNLRVDVVEPTYDKVVIKGRSRIRRRVLERVFGVAAGDRVKTGPLNRALILANRIPGITATGVLIAGSKPATSTLMVHVKDQPLASYEFSVSNYGANTTGAALATIGASLADPFGFGSDLAMYVGSSGSGGLSTRSLSIQFPPLWDGITTGFYANGVDYKVGGAFRQLDLVGRASEVGGYVSAPLEVSPSKDLTLRLDLGQSWYSQSNRSEQSENNQAVLSETLTLSGLFADRYGGLNSIVFAGEHGNVSIAPYGAAVIDQKTLKTAGGYCLADLTLKRDQRLPRGFLLSLKAAGQISSGNLNSAQQFYIGGPYGVMSYPVGSGGGDDGYLVSAKFSHALTLPDLPGSLSVSSLIQAGTIWQNHTLYSGFVGKNKETEADFGFGLSYRWRGVSVSLVATHRLGPNSQTGVNNPENAVWIALSDSI